MLRTSGEDEVIIGTHLGYSVRFKGAVVRDMGRAAAGVKGVNLREGDYVVGTSRIDDSQEVLVISENGLGKRTQASEYPTKGQFVTISEFQSLQTICPNIAKLTG